jgi:predicted tellurium resistance membrane protein TerC
LLVGILFAIDKLQAPFFSFGVEQGAPPGEVEASADAPPAEGEHSGTHAEIRVAEGAIVAGSFNVHSVIVLLGGFFIIYTAFREIFHMLGIEHVEKTPGHKRRRSVGAAVFWIMLMNLVFSFDSILSAIALTDKIAVMATAIVIGGILMIILSDKVAEFLKKNRMYEVLGLFILLVVGILLVSEGGHIAHLHFFGYAVTPMSKTTFYFVIAVMVLIDIVQTRYQKKLLEQRERETAAKAATV